MAVAPEDAVGRKAKKLWLGMAAAAALCTVILLLMRHALRLLSGFAEQLRALFGAMLS